MTPVAKAYQHIYLEGKKNNSHYWYYGFFIAFLAVLFLPWTQTVRARGNVIALRQEQRPQEVNTVIGGRIVNWLVKEGDFVKKGDTLVQLSEIKDSYLDPQLLSRLREQIDAKQSSVAFYENKAGATQTQISALAAALQLKISGLNNKLRQTEIKLQSDSMEAAAAGNDYRIATLQFNRQKSLFDSGLVSLTQLETRNQSVQNTMAKKLSAENKFAITGQDLLLLQIEMNSAQQEYAEKMAKASGERFQSLSEMAAGQGEIAKLQNQYSIYNIRNGMYYIVAPQAGQVIQAGKTGVGEILKEGEMVVNIVPDHIKYGVEMFVRPVDLPLITKGQQVRFLFDGFPAIVFSGWPRASSGTFSGNVAAIERNLAKDGKFRVLINEDSSTKPWPKELNTGTGANGIALLNDVPVWYELWRNINSFPPDYYTGKTEDKPAKKTDY